MRAKMILQYWTKHPFSSFFLIIQLTALLILTGVASSAISSAMQFYKPFSDYFKSQGVFLEISNVSLDGQTLCEDSSELQKQLKEAQILSCYSFKASLHGNSSVTFRAYDPDIIRRYHPTLAQGSWLTPETDSSTMLHAVVWGLPVKIGDTIEATVSDNVTVPVKVIGILDDSASIVGHTTGSRQTQSDYMQMYTQIPKETLVGSVVLLNQKEIMTFKNRYPDIVSPMSDMVLIKYDKNISKETAKKNDLTIEKYTNILNGYYMPDLYAQSVRNIQPTLYFFIPILISAFSLMCVSALCSNAIVVEEQMYSYAIFRLCGMNLRKCVLLNFYHIILDIVIAEGISAWIMRSLIAGRTIMKTTLHYGYSQLLCCLCVGVFYMMFAFVQPYIALHKQTIHKVLID
mgnify:CR=1 FL=1